MHDNWEQIVSNSDKLPQMDMSFSPGKGYDAVNELMRAIILRTIEDFNSLGENREDAIKYLYGFDDDGNNINDEDDEYIFSFASICRHLGMDPDKTRYSIMHAKHRISTRRRAA